MFNKILLACDGSEHSLRSAKKAVDMTKFNKDAQIHIVYVVDSESSKSDVLAYGENAEIQRHQKLAAVEAVLEHADIAYETIILRGEPGPEIVHYANNNQFDLVIVGSRGLNSLQEMVLGSVSHKVAKRVNSPVLIVK